MILIVFQSSCPRSGEVVDIIAEVSCVTLLIHYRLMKWHKEPQLLSLAL